MAIGAATAHLPVHAYPVVAESGNTSASAYSVDGTFTLAPDPDIFASAAIGHTSVIGTINSPTDVDWYRFTAGAGSILMLDIDTDAHGGVFDSLLFLLDSSMSLLAWNDDTFSPPLLTSPYDPGSASAGLHFLNSFIGIYTIAAAGTYYVAVSQHNHFSAAYTACSPSTSLTRPDGEFGGAACDSPVAGGDVFAGADGGGTGGYTLHVSLSDPGVAALPEPVSLALLGLGLAGLGFCRWRQSAR